MSLLGPPSRRPVVRTMYRMRPELYDPTDDRAHPLLCVWIDPVTRYAGLVTRTSTFEAGGRRAVAHQAVPAMGLDRPGWWRVFTVHQVPWPNFDGDDVVVLGTLDERTWERVRRAMFENGGPR